MKKLHELPLLDQIFFLVGITFSSLATVAAIIATAYLLSYICIVATGIISYRMKQTYRHVQLIWVMQEMKEKGRAQFRKDYLEEGNQE